MDTQTTGDQVRVQVGEDERISLPAEVLREMGVKEGDILHVTLTEEGRLSVYTVTEEEEQALAAVERYLEENPEIFRRLAE